MARPQFTEDEERQIELALEVRRRHSKEIEDKRAADDAARPKYDPAKPETNRRKVEKDRRAQATTAPKKRNSLFAA
jgi:predicted DNA-binding transcriptional regulator YafY